MTTSIVVFLAEYLPFVILAIGILFFLWLDIVRKKSMFVFSLLSGVLALIMDKTLNLLIISPRPFVLKGIDPLIAHAADNGFPSEHALFVFLIAGAVFAYNRKLGIILGGMGAFVGIARVIADVHHPIDILGGFLIAVISLVMGWHALRYRKQKVVPETE